MKYLFSPLPFSALHRFSDRQIQWIHIQDGSSSGWWGWCLSLSGSFSTRALDFFSSGCLGFLRVVIVIQKHVFQKIEIWSYLYIKSSAWKRSFLLDSIGQSRYRECLDLWRQNLNLAFSREKQQKKFWRYLWWRKWREAKFTQLCPTLCDPMNYTVHGII